MLSVSLHSHSQEEEEAKKVLFLKSQQYEMYVRFSSYYHIQTKNK
jgi:hypothetical protein